MTYESAESADDQIRDKNSENHGPDDPDLAAIIEAWPTLPEGVRQGILTLIRASGEQRRSG